MLGLVIFISFILIACNVFYEKDEIEGKTDVNEEKLKNKLN
ncbi:hypothetical protein [Clostridium saccharobutylicum]|uniref:Uncharacterized protein n=1 Tax=Clostridium saccharobutylicum TaxID=169679 RepID=A0A1S8NCN4_CLOSA|nr:hypothetical protein [Clostridium saccharobutylicum]OOM14245.1 hypothetical protein CLOSAC_11180 [Clostridium saccharobutylicum]